jgi:hypothetical protein
MNKYTKWALFFVLGTGATACSADVESSDANPTDSDEMAWTTVPGLYQTRLASTTREEMVIAFDRKEKKDTQGCDVIVASPLRIRLYSNGLAANTDVSVNMETFISGRTVAYTKSKSDSPGLLKLRPMGAAFGADVPEVVIQKRCSGELIQYYQQYQFKVGGRILINPVGNTKEQFLGQLIMAPASGISPEEKRRIDLQTSSGTTVNFEYTRLAGDDPKQPGTCALTEAARLRVQVIPVKTANPVKSVKINIQSIGRPPTGTEFVDPSSPGVVELTSQGGGVYSAEVRPFKIGWICSGTSYTYTQKIGVEVNGKAESDRGSRSPVFRIDMNARTTR